MPAPENYGGGNDDLYGDAAPSANPSPKPTDSTAGRTALLPKNFCPGMEPGDEMVVKIVRVHDDQYEVEYSAEPSGEKETPAPAPAPMPAAPAGAGGLAEMMG